MANIFGRNDTIKAPWDISYDADGKGWMYAIAGGTLVANTPYLIVADEYGPITGATTATHGGYIGVAESAAVAGDYVRLQVAGPVAALITPSLSISVGHGLSIASSVVADSGADYIGSAAQFAVCTVASTTSTTQAIVLVTKIVTAG